MTTSLKSNTTEHHLVLAANQQLEAVFQRKADACVALLISRNYRLLVQHQSPMTEHLNWMQKAKYWWQQYLNLTTGKRYHFMSGIDQGAVLFKRVDMHFSGR
jgi:hypothetical protein